MTPALSAALVAAQRSAQSVIKEGRNLQQRDAAGKPIAYARGEDMIEEAREALNAADLALSRLSTKLAGDPSSELFRLDVVYLLEHGPSGESREYPVSYWAKPHKGMPHDKAEAAAHTYALAYFLRDLLLIPRRLQGEVSPDERDERQTNYEPRQRAEQRGWGAAQGEQTSGTLAPPLQQTTAKMPVESAGVVTPFDAPNPEVVYAGFLDSIGKATAQTIDAVWAEVHKCPPEELPEANYESLRAYVRQRKIDFCREPVEFGDCARAIQKGFDGEAREKLRTYFNNRKAAVLGGPDPARDPLPSPPPDDEIPY